MMSASEVERVRMRPQDRRLLRRLARETGSSKSEVLREGLRLVERVRLRRKNIHLLVEAARVKGDRHTKARLAR